MFMATMMFLLLICILVFIHMGNLLVVDHDMVKADAIVVLMGGPETTVREASELYLKGFAGVIIMAQTAQESLEPDPETGFLPSGETERSKLLLMELGVPEEGIIIIPSMTTSTREEAEAVRDYLAQRQDIDSLILVTRGYHTRRSIIIFTRALKSLDRDVELISRASRYDPFHAEVWWWDEQNARQVHLEYLKIVNYYFLEFFKVELANLIDYDKFF